MQSTSSKYHRVYIKNLSYFTCEEDLEELFKKYEPVSVLIPSYTIRFSRKDRQRPLGIAYAEFKTPDQIDAVVKEFDGIILKNRKMSVKKHYPYNPKRRNMFKRNDTNQKPNETEKPQDSTKAIVKKDNKPVVTRAIEVVPSNNNDEQKSLVSIANSELSIDTVYIPKAHGKITDEAIRDFFKDYRPAQIYIFRDKPKRGPINLKGNYVSVLAKVDSSQIKLEDIISNLKAQKLNGRHVELQPALKSKVEEASLAASRLKPLLLTSGGPPTNDRKASKESKVVVEPPSEEVTMVEESSSATQEVS